MARRWRACGRDGSPEGVALRAREVEGGPAQRARAERGAAAVEALDGIDERLPAVDKLRLVLRAHPRVVAEQLDVATVFVREWRYLEGGRREAVLAERRRHEERIRALFHEGVEQSELRTDLDVNVAALLFLSAANWPYTLLQRGRDTDAFADRFFELLVDGMRGYATPRP
jgi:hypothetical protein